MKAIKVSISGVTKKRNKKSNEEQFLHACFNG